MFPGGIQSVLMPVFERDGTDFDAPRESDSPRLGHAAEGIEFAGPGTVGTDVLVWHRRIT